MSTEYGAILVISGPSGAGKSSLINKVKELIGDFYFSISTTTRPIRTGEEESIHYHYVSKEEFKQDIEDDNFLEYALVHGNYYGTSLKPVKKALKKGQLVIFDIDVQGNAAVRNRLGDISTSVFVTTPSLKILKERLTSRATDTQEVIKNRISMAKIEVQRINEYDFLIINDDLDVAAEKLINIAKASRAKMPSVQINEFVHEWEDNA
ncbi:MAG: guanylate kinase [Helicobacteraceae bacterium]|nr:guanylate kinase [Helicobacteraceae bacterium]